MATKVKDLLYSRTVYEGKEKGTKSRSVKIKK
jgi:hypothetical protein